MTKFPAILDGSDTVWGIRFPDVPGCFGAGASPEEAIADATSALRMVATQDAAANEPLPTPSPIAAVLKSGEVGDGESVVLIPLVLDAGRTVRANLTLDAWLLEAIDAAARERGVTRSAFMATAAREKILNG